MIATWINGKPADKISCGDRGLAYGDGLFETIAVVGGRPQLWNWHIERLLEGCRRLRLPPPDTALLWEESTRLCQELDGSSGVLKLTYTRGTGGRGYAPPGNTTPTRILALSAWPQWPASRWEEGVALFLCQTRLAEQPQLAGLKHLNRLEQVLARAEWDDPQWAEGLVRDPSGGPVEGVSSNLFAVVHGRLITPPLDRCGVAGVMRRNIMQLADKLGVPAEVRALSLPVLRTVDEVFMSNSLAGIWPVRALSDRTTWTAPGPVTRRLQSALRRQGVVPGPEQGEK